jgi:hypothetical protein
MKRKELQHIYGFGANKIRKLVRDAGILHQKELLPIEVELFIKHVGKPIKPSFFDRV